MPLHRRTVAPPGSSSSGSPVGPPMIRAAAAAAVARGAMRRRGRMGGSGPPLRRPHLGPPSPTDPPVPPRENLTPWQKEWLAKFTPGMEWAAFLATLEELVTLLSPAPNPSRQPRPGGIRPARPRRPRRDGDRDVREAARIQNLYRTAPKRAMKEGPRGLLADLFHRRGSYYGLFYLILLGEGGLCR
ncbi:hypothetical protein J6590_082029 [Homalodisca vitripennis]|nr:hypothetical protein J6590_082029 [Homalodisca vitripennis]